MPNEDDIIVIGAGLGGLCAGALLARDGYRVRVLEAATQPGGRARSRAQDGYVLNLGAHALYRHGPAMAVLAELGIEPRGRVVDGVGAYVLTDDRLCALPRNATSLLGGDLLGWRGKLAFARTLLTLGERKARALRGRSVRQWLSEETADPRTRKLLELFVRLTCYAHAPELLAADTAVRQLAHAVEHGVMYVDGGWQALLDGVLARVEAERVRLELGVAVERIEHVDGAVTGVVLGDGRRLRARAVVAAVGPSALAKLLPGDGCAQRWADAAVPLRAACLDLGVRGLPHRERVNVQALDAPLYFANHSAYARLAPEGASVLHLIRYLAPGEDGRGVEPELRAFLERVQPGVSARAELERFVPNLIVHGDLPGPERARAEHPELAGLHLVGDGCSPHAMLTDGVLDSARTAATRIAARLRSGPVAKTPQARDPGRAA
jgi:phytoene dehydrogenase-like protein